MNKSDLMVEKKVQLTPGCTVMTRSVIHLFNSSFVFLSQYSVNLGTNDACRENDHRNRMPITNYVHPQEAKIQARKSCNKTWDDRKEEYWENR